MAFSGWSQTAGSNTSVGGVSIAEGMSPGGVNNAIRGLMAEVAIWRDLVGGKVVSGGTADVQTVTTGMSMAAYAQGILMAFEAGAGLTNTGAMTINVDAIGAKSVKLTTGANPAAGAVTAGGIYLIAYEATSDTLLLLNPSVVTPASHVHAASDITSGTLVHERGGLEADVSAYAGFVKITGGSTSAVAVSANGESLITAANYAAMRGLLDLEAGTDFLAPSSIYGTETFFIKAAAFTPTTTNGAQRYLNEDPTNDLMEDSLAFDTTTQEFATIDIPLPIRWALGTVTFTPYWRGTGSAAQTVQWGFSAVAVSNDDAMDAAPGSVVTSSDTWLADGDLHIGPTTAACTIAGTPADYDFLRIKVQRDVASDNLGNDARFQGVLVTITTDQTNDA